MSDDSIKEIDDLLILKIVNALRQLKRDAAEAENEEIQMVIESAYNVCYVSYISALRLAKLTTDNEIIRKH